MSGFIRLVAALAIAATLTPVADGRAQSLDGADQAAIRALIGDQIAAFQRDDDAAAYALAAPGIQDMFPSVESFMAMVRGSYTPVYRPRSVVFGPLVEEPGGPLQRVFVTGPDGLHYVAIYSLERQADGSWRISGCALVRDDRPSI